MRFPDSQQDAFAAVRNGDVVGRPGFTWATTSSEFDPKDHWDRIDFVFAGTARKAAEAQSVLCKVKTAQMLGESAAEADVVVSPWPSDHRAVLAEIVLGRIQAGLAA